MLTPETIDVLRVAVVAYGLVLAVIVARRVRDRRWRRSAADGRSSGVVAARSSPRAARRDEDELASFVAAHARDIVDIRGVRPAARLGSATAWLTWLDEETTRVERYGRPATIVLVELAGLDRLGERIGAEAAERLIPPVGATVRGQARAADRVAQLGPHRFGVLLLETDEIQAIHYVERVRSACDLWLAAGAIALRLSVGWASIRPDVPATAALAEADLRLGIERRRLDPDDAPSAPSSPAQRPTVLQATGS